MAGDSIEQYKVIISRKELDKLQSWGAWAVQAGVLDEYLVTLKTINYRLSFEPLDWGEPHYTLRQLNLAVMFGTFKMLNVWYAVQRDKCLVFVKLFQFRGDYPRGQPPESS